MAPTPKELRAAVGLPDPSPEPTVCDQAGLVVDRFWVDGQQIDAKHVSSAEVDAWVRDGEAGEEGGGHLMPVVSFYGLVEGIVLWDHRGVAAGLRARLRHVPSAFRDRAT